MNIDGQKFIVNDESDLEELFAEKFELNSNAEEVPADQWLCKVENIGKRDLQELLASNYKYEYIGLGSKWGNPFKVSEFGRMVCISKFDEYFRNSGLINDICELKQKVVLCHCDPRTCHCHLLAKLLNESS